MCGIVAYVGRRPVVPILLEGLRRLEYRGYDSAGIALLTPDGIETHRTAGKIGQLTKLMKGVKGSFHCGIGHTRWATHGRPSEENAHPHRSRHIAVVHNGIIENYLTLRADLTSRKVRLQSETDTEVIPHLIEAEGKTDLASIAKAVSVLEGSFALAIIDSRRPEEIFLARQGSPLVMGIGDGECWAASDIPALLPFTKKVIILEDGDIARLSSGAVTIIDSSGTQSDRSPITLDWDLHQAEKGGYKHFMLKEIHDQPQAVLDTFRGRIEPATGELLMDKGSLPSLLKQDRRITMVACGTSFHAGLVGKNFFETLVGIPTEVVVASEFRYRPLLIDSKTDLVIAISQSGETADTLAAVSLARKKGIPVLAICNVVESSLAREADAVLYTRAGPEIAVASTKAFATQLTALFMIALATARLKNKMTADSFQELLLELFAVPGKMTDVLKKEADFHSLARQFSSYRHFLFLGRQIHYPVAMEGALKLKEISYVHAEAYPAGEMKHGPIALIDDSMPALVVAPKGETFTKTVSNIKEIQSRDGNIILLTTEPAEKLDHLSSWVIPIPETPEILSPLVSILPLQLFAYYVADRLGHDVDQPRNLAKSVTVE